MISRKIIALSLFSALALAPAGLLRAQGHPADSGKIPWKLPFLVELSASFKDSIKTDTMIHGQISSGNSVTENRWTGINMVVDSSFSCLFYGKTIAFTKDSAYDNEYSYQDNLTITFNSGYDSILSLSCSNGVAFNCNHCESETVSTFSFYGLRFDSTSIIYPDSSLSHTGFSYSSIGWGDLGNINQGLLLDTESSIGVFQVTLGGIFRPMTLTPPSVVSNSNRPSTIPIQSFPNPFSQSTTISFSLPESGLAEISIVNLLGTEVARVFSGELEVGEYDFEWHSAPGLPDGVYQCLLRMNGRVETLPIVLLR